MGGAYTQAVTQAPPAMLQGTQRNTQNYLIDPRAGLRDTRGEAAAIASGALIGDALGKGMMKVATAFHEADGASQYGRAKQDFTLWNTAMEVNYKSQPYTQRNEDPTRKYEYYPTYPNMVEDYLEDAQAELESYAAEITHDKYRAKFLSETSTRIRSTAKTLWTYQNAQHMQWLQGETQSRLFAASSLTEVEEILSSHDALASHDAKELQELKETYTRVVSNRWAGERYLEAQKSEQSLMEFIELAQYGGINTLQRVDPNDPESKEFETKLLVDEQWESHRRFMTQGVDGDISKWVKRAEDQIKSIQTERARKLTVSVGIAAKNILDGDYTEEKLDQWVKEHPGATVTQINALRSLIKAKAEPLIGNMSEFAEMREDIEAYSITAIAGNENLDFEQRRTLIEKRMRLEEGQALWEDKNHPSGPWGHRALARLKRAFRIATLDMTDPNTFLPGAAGAKQIEKLNRYQDAVTDLEDYLYGPNAEDGKYFTEAEMPKAAWDWVLAHEAAFKNEEREVINVGTGDATTDAAIATQQQKEKEAAVGFIKSDGTPWTLAEIQGLPPGPLKERILEKFREAGIDTSGASDTGMKDDQSELDDGKTPEELFNEKLRKANPVHVEKAPITILPNRLGQ